MRVLYVSHTGAVGGAEHSLLTLIEGLPADVEPILASPAGPLSVRALALGVRVVELPGTAGSFRLHPLRTPRALLNIGRSAIRLRGIAHRSGADLMHANSVRAGLIAVLARAGGAPPALVHVRDVLPAGPAASAVRRAVLCGARRTICISEHVARAFEFSGTPERVVAVHNGVDLRRFDPRLDDRDVTRTGLGLTRDDRALGVLAQITPWKGQDDAIAAFAAVRPSQPNARLFLIGETKFVSADTRYDNRAFEAGLVEQAERLGVASHVHLLGERRDVPALLNAMDVVLVPSWEEPFGRSVIEAMAMERAVVATNMGGPTEIVEHGVTGLLAPPRDVAAWSELVRRLLEDDALRSSLGRLARASLVGRFDQESHVARVVQVYREALDASG